MEDELAKIAAQAAYSWVTDTVSNGAKFLTKKNALKKCLQIYIERYSLKHGKIKVLGMNSPRNINTIFTSVKVASPSYLSRLATVDSMEFAYRSKGDRSFFPSHKESNDAIDVANSERLLNVLGAPGAGKSTLLKRLGIASLESFCADSAKHQVAYQHKKIPVFLQLSQFDPDTISIKEFIQEEFGNSGFNEHLEDFVENALENGLLLILLDGLDEVSLSKIDKTIRNVASLVKKYPENRYVTSCRTAFYRNHFTSFRDVVITDFSAIQIKSFIDNWFVSCSNIKNSVSSKLNDLLFKKENASTLDLAGTPLLLTFICIVYDATQNLPTNRASLYERALRILLEGWAAEKRVHQDKDNFFTSEYEIEILSDLAGEAFQKNQLFFGRLELIKHFERYLDNEINRPKGVDGAKVLAAIELRQGIIVERASDIFSFSHLTIQEYLTARWYRLSNKRIIDLIESDLTNQRWREVFLLICGLGKSDDYLTRMVIKHKTTKDKLDASTIDLIFWTTFSGANKGGGESGFFRRIKALLLISSIFASRASSAYRNAKDYKRSSVNKISALNNTEANDVITKLREISEKTRRVVEELCRLVTATECVDDPEEFCDSCDSLSWDGDFCMCDMLEWEFPEVLELVTIAYSEDSSLDSDSTEDDLLDNQSIVDLQSMDYSADDFDISKPFEMLRGEFESFLRSCISIDILTSNMVKDVVQNFDELEDLNEEGKDGGIVGKMGPTFWNEFTDGLGIKGEFLGSLVEDSEIIIEMIRECVIVYECKSSSLSLSKRHWSDLCDSLIAI